MEHPWLDAEHKEHTNFAFLGLAWELLMAKGKYMLSATTISLFSEMSHIWQKPSFSFFSFFKVNRFLDISGLGPISNVYKQYQAKLFLLWPYHIAFINTYSLNAIKVNWLLTGELIELDYRHFSRYWPISTRLVGSESLKKQFFTNLLKIAVFPVCESPGKYERII